VEVKEILEEISRCSFCGFCEMSCPTRFLIKRNYTPRGRVNTISLYLKGLATEESVNGLFSCLGCGACSAFCPAGINIPEVIRSFRKYMLKLSEVK
jgi:glycolate oxidase iron-sulfur subunit